MKLMDLYYRAFQSFKAHTFDDPYSQRLRRIITHSDDHLDVLTAIKYACVIESDWIENIEEGLIYVEKAIQEDRQFIRTEGEVVPIEKVKRTSKSSIEHLSRHSDLITRAPGVGQHLIPDKLYIVEKLNDYLVYENRFLYMLLRYLKDFIQIRLDAIKDKTTSYESSMTIQKTFSLDQRHLTYHLSFDDTYKNDPYLVDQYKKIPLVNRLETIHALTISLLATPLMKEVSKAPLIKPPVVKTNILRMNPNFRVAMKLYEFITSYNKNGYIFKEIKKTFNPFPPDMSDDIAETIQLTSTISYIVGSDATKDFELRFESYQKAEQDAQNQKMAEEIKRLKKRMVEMHLDPAEYIIKLEKRNNQLEKDRDTLSLKQEKNDHLQKVIIMKEQACIQLQSSIDDIQMTLTDQIQTTDTLKQKYFDDMTEAENVHQLELIDANERHRQEISQIHEAHDRERQLLIQKHLDEQKALLLEHENEKAIWRAEMDDLGKTISNLKSDIEHMLSDHQRESETLTQTINTLQGGLKHLDGQKKAAHAQYMALKMQQGLLTEEDDFTSKERFKEMEAEMAAYKKLFKEQWKKTKSKIRHKVRQEVFSKSTEDESDQKPDQD